MTTNPYSGPGGGTDPTESAVARRPDDGFAASLADLVEEMQDHRADAARLLQVIVDGAVDLIPGTEGAGVLTSSRRGQLEAQAATGDLPPAVLRMQNEVGVGPCFQAVSQTTAVYVRDTRVDTRWPEFMSRALALRVRSMLCTPLVADGRVFGSLSLVSTAPRAFGDESKEFARIFAVHAAVAVAGGEYRADFDDGLLGRDVIGQAKGILMERFRITHDVAFSVLLRTSQHTNVKIRDVCRHLCETGELLA